MQLPRNATTQACLLMLMATLFLSCMHALVRHLGQDMHPFVIVFFRNVFGLLAILPLFIRSGLSVLRTPNTKLYVLRAVISVLAMLSWFTGLSKVPIANATALSFSQTLFVTLIAWLFLGEVLRWRRIAAIVVGLVGVFVVLRPGMDGFNQYSLLIIFSAIAWGISISLVKRLSTTDSATCIVGWMAISLSVLSLFPAILHWQTPTLNQLVFLLLIGTLATTGHLLMTRAVQMAETSTVMSVDFARLVWTAIIGSIFFGELLDIWTVVGALIIFGSGWYIIFRESKLATRS